MNIKIKSMMEKKLHKHRKKKEESARTKYKELQIMEIIYENDTELAEWEALNKGYRADITVKINGLAYKIYVTSLFRLQQDFETEQQDSGYYSNEPNTIIVRQTSKKEIEDTIQRLYNERYFELLENRGFDKLPHEK